MKPSKETPTSLNATFMVWFQNRRSDCPGTRGLAAEHPSRIEAGIVFALNEMSNDGHVYSPRDMLAGHAIELLDVSPDLIPLALERLAQDEELICAEMLPIPGRNNTKIAGTSFPFRPRRLPEQPAGWWR